MLVGSPGRLEVNVLFRAEKGGKENRHKELGRRQYHRSIVPTIPKDSQPCPCGRGLDYGSCCGPIHREDAGLGTTAEQLMRARYSAYVLHDGAFLRSSWHPDTRPGELSFDPATTWTGLTIENTEAGGGLDRAGTVAFVARFSRVGNNHELRELSRFERVDGRWRYLDGQPH